VNCSSAVFFILKAVQQYFNSHSANFIRQQGNLFALCLKHSAKLRQFPGAMCVITRYCTLLHDIARYCRLAFDLWSKIDATWHSSNKFGSALAAPIFAFCSVQNVVGSD
jgi:hypothetical protein